MVIGDIDDGEGSAAARELGGGQRVRYVRCDVRDGRAVEAMIGVAPPCAG